jgi:hypothetical protein
MTTFNYTGGVQTFVVPAGVTLLTCELLGSVGKGGTPGRPATPGNGGYIKATLAVTPGETLYLQVGGNSNAFDGGISGAANNPGAGGDSSDIRQGGSVLANRVIVAGGGGGGAWFSSGSVFPGGAGGGLVGATGSGPGGTGGTQSAGGTGAGGGGNGALGAGGLSAFSTLHVPGAGGGGFYGGGGGASAQGGGGGSSAAVGGIVTNTQGANASLGQIVITYAVPPLAPTLTNPANGASIDATGGVTFTGVYNPDPANAVNANARALRMRVGGVTYYWNQSTASWQSGIIYNPVTILPGAASSFGPITGSNGTTIQFSMSDQESSGNLQGPFAPDFVVMLQAGPALTIGFPTGVVTNTNAPELAYTPTPAAGSAIIGGRWLVYTSPQTIDIGGGTIPSGAVSDVTWGANPLTVPLQGGVVLSNGITYYAYAAVEETGSLWSSTVESVFSIELDLPAAPSETLSLDPGDLTHPSSVKIDIQAHDNLCSVDDASFEGGFGSAVAVTNCTVDHSAGGGLDGPGALRVASVAAGNMAFTQGPYPVTAGDTYSWMGHFNPDGNPARTVRVDAVWYNGATLLSTTAGTPALEVWTGTFATSWVQAIGSGVAPAGATQVYLVEYVLATAGPEGHNVDEVGVFPGVVTAWTRGGLQSQTIISVLRSDGAYVRGAGLLDRQAIPWPRQHLIIHDYEPRTDTEYTYTAVVGSVVTFPATYGPGTDVGPISVPAIDTWWAFDPLDMSTAFAFYRAPSQSSFRGGGSASLQLDSADRMGVFWGLGADTYTVRHGDLMAEEFDLAMTFLDTESWEKFDALRKRQTTVCLRSDMESEVYYVSFGPARPRVIMRASDRTTNTVSQVVVHCFPVPVP